jgi:hypothetical protein
MGGSGWELGVFEMKRIITLSLAAAATMAVASPAQAALVSTGACNVGQVTSVPGNQAATSCSGWWSGNLLGNSAAQIADTQAALALLGFVWNGSTIVQNIPSGNPGGIIDFNGILSGNTIIGVHRGGNGRNGDPGNATAFFRWSNLSPTDKLKLNITGLSGQTLYLTTFSQVPEPGTWMLMIAGIGLMGWQLRRRRQTVKVTYA